MGWIGFVALVYIVIAIGVGVKFGEVAEKKGYNNGTWTIASIIVGLPVWMLVIALPNERQHNELLAALNQAKSSGSSVISNDLPEL